MHFVFNKEDHQYTLDGVALPSVTDVLDLVIDTTFMTEEGRDRGKMIHEAIEIFEKGEDCFNISCDFPVGYIQSWINFKKDYKYQGILLEHSMCHPKRRYAGTLDHLGKGRFKPGKDLTPLIGLHRS